jgi:adenylate cyclase
MPPVRRLTAILAADVAGYSRLMGADEEGTHERLKAHLGELVNPKIAEHWGRIVKNTGDGFLAEFASVIDAVRCAVEVQRGMAERNAGTLPEQRIEFRVGINLGDVIAEREDIFGDGVNIAARLEGLAEPGGVLVSNTVHDHVRDRLPFVFEDLGEQQVKNIARPVRVYRVLDTSGAKASSSSASPPLALPDKPSIAVLPFANMSGDPGQEYFADGIAEDVVALPLAVRHRAQLLLHLQGPRRRCEAGRARTRRALRPGRRLTQSRQPHPRHRSIGRGRNRQACLGRAL